MIAEDEDALICDLAETYGIYDYEALPPKLVATLAAGLSQSSRSMRRMASGNRIETKDIPSNDQLVMMSILDGVRTIAWMLSKDGAKNRNRPKSVVEAALNKTKAPGIRVFNSPEEFNAAHEAAMERARSKKHG